MTRLTLAIVAAFAGGLVSLQPAQAYQAPWCAVIQNGISSVYWDCQYRSFEDCYRRGNILGGNKGFCNPSPYYVPSVDSRPTKRRSRPQ